MSAWAPLVPLAKERTGLDEGGLGLLLLGLGLGSIAAMPSQVLRTYPTSQRREQQGYGFWPFLLRPVLAHWAPLRSPSFCAEDFPTCTGSPTARDQSMTGV
jgi:hypothetical protein